MSQLPIQEAIPRFKANEERVDNFVNGAGYYNNQGVFVPGLGKNNFRGNWAASTAYQVFDIVNNGGTFYQCLIAHTSTGSFDSSKWVIYQGVTSGQLSPNTGASLVGANDGASGSLFSTVAGFISYILGTGGAGIVGFSTLATYANSTVGFVLKAIKGSNGAAEVGYGSETVKDVLDRSRVRLTANRAYYVRTDGSDSNTGLVDSAGGAFLTTQKAIDVILQTLDFNGFDVTVQVRDGTFTAGLQVLAPTVGKGILRILGNDTTPANCIIDMNGLAAFYAENGASIYVSGFTVINSGGEGIYAQTGAKITVGKMRYGACSNSHVTIGGGGFVNLTQDYTIFGGGASHLHAGSIGAITSSTITATIAGTPAFSSYFCGAAEGTITCKDITFSGTATGPTHLAHKNGVIDTHPAFAALPGSIAGRTATGGRIIGSQTTPDQIAPNQAANNSVRWDSYNVTTGIFTNRFVTDSQPTGSGGGSAWAYVNGDDSYMSGRTHLGCATIVALANTNDGLTVTPATAAFFSQTSIACQNLRRQGTDGAIINFYKGGAAAPQVGSITVTGSATAFNTSSDYRLKNYIGPIKGAWNRVKAIKTAEFVFKSDESETVVRGYIAHELAESHPLAVTGDKDAMQFNEETEQMEPVYQGVDPSKTIADLTAALQEAMIRIERLEAKLNA